MLAHKDVMRSFEACAHIQKPCNMAPTNSFQAEGHEYCSHHSVIFLDSEQLLYFLEQT